MSDQMPQPITAPQAAARICLLARLDGPALTVLGLAPRASITALTDLNMEHA